MMRKVLLGASLILFLQAIFLFVFKGDLHAYTKCYVDEVLIGDMHTWDHYYGYPFLVKGGWGTVEFAAYKGVVAKNEVQFRPGGEAWTPYSFLQIKSTRDRYFLDFAVPNDNKCGPWWTNTMFRYLLDGQNHYCDDRTVKYSLGPYKSDFINPGCLNTATGCKLSDPLARQAGFHSGYEIEATIPEGKSCSDYKFYIYNGSTAAPGTFQYLGPQECKIASGRFSWPANGEITAFTSNFLEVYVHDASGQLQLYNFINDLYCGGCLACNVGPTPTPTISAPCSTLMAQTVSSGGSGKSLLNVYDNTQSVQLTSTLTGDVDKAEIYAYTDRDIPTGGKLLYCKLVQGNCDQASLESFPYEGPYSANVNTWMRVYFPIVIPIVSGEEYRLCCRVNHRWGGGALYWRNGPVGDLTNRPRKLYVCLTTPTPTPTSTPTPTVTPTPSVAAWFQTREGDVNAGGEINSKIPLSATNLNFSTNDAGNYPGIVSYGTSVSMGSGFPSASTANHWLVQTTNPRKSFDYFYSLLDSPPLNPPPDDSPGGLAGEIDDTQFSDGGIYAYNGDVATVDDGWNIGNKKIVVLTNKGFLIKGRIRIDTANGGSLVVIARDNIGIDKNLVATGGVQNKLQGVFITDGIFNSSVDPDYDFLSAASNQILVIDGLVVANSFTLGRDFSALGGGDYNNSTTPAETFRYDPTLVMNTHQGLWNYLHSWKELTP